MAWAYDQKNITDYYEYYFKIMKFWKTKIPNFIYDAKYESIVNSPESEIKKMLSFCDLNWDPECLNFYKNKKLQFKPSVFLKLVNQFINHL